MNLTQPQAKMEELEKVDLDDVQDHILFAGWPKLSEWAQRLYVPVKPMQPANPGRRTIAENKDLRRYRKQRRQFTVTEGLVFKALVTFGASLDKARTLAKKTVHWDNVYHGGRANHTTLTGTHFCKMRSNLAYRLNNRWVVGAVVTQDHPEAHLAKMQRGFLNEYLYLNAQDTVLAHPFFLDMNKGENPKRYWIGPPISPPPNRTRVATKMARYGGPAGINYFGSKPFEKNVAFISALSDSHAITQQVLASKSVSNTAILAFPIIMAAVPIALIADVSNRVTFVYLIFTDILTVLPLLIKGAELLGEGLKEYFSTRSLVYGNLNKEGTVAVATWSVRCTSAQNLIAYGAAFIAVAICAMVLGITLEFLARAKVEKNKRRAAAEAADAFSRVEHVWSRTGLGEDCECFASSSNSASPSASQPSFGGGLIGQIQQRRKKAIQRSDGESPRRRYRKH